MTNNTVKLLIDNINDFIVDIPKDEIAHHRHNFIYSFNNENINTYNLYLPLYFSKDVHHNPDNYDEKYILFSTKLINLVYAIDASKPTKIFKLLGEEYGMSYHDYITMDDVTNSSYLDMPNLILKLRLTEDNDYTIKSPLETFEENKQLNVSPIFEDFDKLETINDELYTDNEVYRLTTHTTKTYSIEQICQMILTYDKNKQLDEKSYMIMDYDTVYDLVCNVIECD
mgnify:CR=1 FL=1